MSWVWHRGPLSDDEPDWNAPLHDEREARLRYLYDWERRCCGYDLFPAPVVPEPPFVSYQPDAPGGLARQLQSHPLLLQGEASPPLAVLGIRLPVEQKVTFSSVQTFLASLINMATPRAGGAPLSFEILGDGHQIAYQMACAPESLDAVASAARLQWPRGEFAVEADALTENFPPELRQNINAHSFLVEFGLQEMAFLPLAWATSLASDPMAALIGVLGGLCQGERAGLQILFAPVARRWNEALFQVAGEFEDDEARGRSSRSATTRGTVWQNAAHLKLQHPLLAAVIRVFALSVQGAERAFALCKRLGSALTILHHAQAGGHQPLGNALMALANQDDSFPQDEYSGVEQPRNGLIATVFQRVSLRGGALLALPELATLLHPPTETLLHPALRRLPDPVEEEEQIGLSDWLLDASGPVLGLHDAVSEQRGLVARQTLVWPEPMRNRHAYLLGATRMGKSTLLMNLIAQDMEAGRGLCLIDPHGDLALDLLERVPPERADDTFYLDLSDRDFPLAMGLLEAHGELERRLLCSDLLAVLHRLFAASWGDRLEHILRHALLTLISANESAKNERPYTLRDLRPLLSSKSFRARVLSRIQDSDLLTFWESEFKSYAGGQFAPIYNKLGLLFSTPLVRNIVGGRESRLDLAHLMNRKKVLLVNLAGGRLGTDQAHFLGALFVSKIQIAAMSQLRLPPAQRVPFTLYVDEFQHFMVSSFESILSEAGKACLSLVMANQFLEQLSGSLQSAILGNAGTLVSFRVSSDSGRLLEKEFAGKYGAAQLVSQERGQAIARIGSARDVYDITTLPPPPHPEYLAGEAILQQTRRQLCRPRREVEGEMEEDARRLAHLLAEEEEDKASRSSGRNRSAPNSPIAPKSTASKPSPFPNTPSASPANTAAASSSAKSAQWEEESAEPKDEEIPLQPTPNASSLATAQDQDVVSPDESDDESLALALAQRPATKRRRARPVPGPRSTAPRHQANAQTRLRRRPGKPKLSHENESVSPDDPPLGSPSILEEPVMFGIPEPDAEEDSDCSI